MRQSPPDTALPPPEPPACAPTLAWIQGLLDGENAPEPREAAAHRAGCPACAARYAGALRLIEGLANLSPPAVPILLTERILDGLTAEPVRHARRNIRIIAACVALAASVFIAVLAVVGWPEGPATRVVVSSSFVAPKEPEPEPARPSPLTDALNQAGTAAAALTRKTAEESFSVKLPTLSLPRMPMDSGPLEDIEPAVTGLQNGAALSVSPIASSAKRAANMFWRELGPAID